VSAVAHILIKLHKSSR